MIHRFCGRLPRYDHYIIACSHLFGGAERVWCFFPWLVAFQVAFDRLVRCLPGLSERLDLLMRRTEEI